MPATKNENAYRMEKEAQTRARIQALLRDLPACAADFTRSMLHGKSEATRLGYVYDLRLFFRYLHEENPAFADVLPMAVTPDMLGALTLRDFELYAEYLAQYVKRDGAGKTTLNRNREQGTARKLSALRSFFKYLYTHGLTPSNVPASLAMPKIHKKAVLYLERAEIEKMFDAAASGAGLGPRQRAYNESFRARDVAIIALLLGTGIRESELIGLDIGHIHLENRSFLITRKGGNEAVLFFNQAVGDALAAYLAQREKTEPLPGSENALFLSSQRRRLSPRALQNLIKKYAAVAAPLKKRLSPHKMRSTFATNLYQATHDIYQVSEVLGHASIETTTRYTAKNDMKERAAALVDWVEGEKKAEKEEKR